MTCPNPTAAANAIDLASGAHPSLANLAGEPPTADAAAQPTSTTLNQLLETSRQYLFADTSPTPTEPAPASNLGDQASRLIKLLSECLAPAACRCTG